MKLLQENELIWSSVVVNNRMNRERNAIGINSYHKEFKIDIYNYLNTIKNEEVAWLDLCCGNGNAIIQIAEKLSNDKFNKKIKLKGIDLIETFNEKHKQFNFTEFEVNSLLNMNSTEKFDLITCFHGLSYIGDKLKVITLINDKLTEKGFFIGNLDMANLQCKDLSIKESVKILFKDKGISYNTKTRIIQFHKIKQLHFNCNYLGADDKFGPNYSGQDSVKSYYI